MRCRRSTRSRFCSSSSPFERLAPALAGVNRPRLLRPLVDRQHQAAAHQLLVDVNRGRGQEGRHRPLHPVLVGDQAPGLRVLAGGGNRELALRLQQLQGVGGALGALLLDQHQHLVLEVLLAQLEQPLAVVVQSSSAAGKSAPLEAVLALVPEERVKC
ncbi:MAG: hypothetical protein J2P44_03590 [Candidatus Dormibacteraeota bacterium]|nr:hypothetical protein [Candidatus Dormibacteraeota bacterium]